MADSSKKPLYQPWNEEEFQADVFVRGMNHMQRWMYRCLLQSSFFFTTRPYLPIDDKVLWVLAGCENRAQWEASKTEVLERFTPVDGNPSLMENKRVTADWGRLAAARDKMSELGQRSAAARSTFNGGSTGVERNTTGIPVLLNVQSTKVKVETQLSEAKRSETEEEIENEKPQLQESRAANVVLHSQGRPAPATPPQGQAPATPNWKDIAIQYRTVFGRQASTKFKARYFDACQQYGSEAVVECFNNWAPNARAWAERENVEHPLHAFFKQLAALVEDVVETKNAENEFQAAEQERQVAEQRRAAVIETNAQRQEKEQQAFLRKGDSPAAVSEKKAQTTSEGDAMDYLAEAGF